MAGGDVRSIVAGADECVESLVRTFREHPHAFYLENSIHCHLYHLLATRGLNNAFQTAIGYWMHQIQKEYPPVKPEEGGRRGRFDLVVFDEGAISRVNWWNHRWHDGERNGVPIQPAVAFELGLNKGLVREPVANSRSLKVADKEIRRLTHESNGIQKGYWLYFYRYAAGWQGPAMKKILDVLGPKLTKLSKNPRIEPRVVAVGFDDDPKSKNRYQPVEHVGWPS